MSPKEKANELANKMYEGKVFDKSKEEHLLECQKAKQRALIAVDEILRSEPRSPNDVDWDDAGGTHYYYMLQYEEAEKYWNEVKQEIEKL